jgi:hypothetical protein
MKKPHRINNKRYEIWRKRWDHEDTLLVSRTGIFLTANSIFWAALSFQSTISFFHIIIGLLALLISILWVTTSWHSFNIIMVIFHEIKVDFPFGIENIYKKGPVLFRPNIVFGKLLPILMIISWIIEIIYSMIKIIYP